MDKSYDKFKQKWHNNLPLDCWYPGGLGRYTRFKVLHPSTSNQSSVRLDAKIISYNSYSEEESDRIIN